MRNKPRLNITLDLSLETEGFEQVDEKSHETVLLSPEQARQYYGRCDTSRVALYVVAFRTPLDMPWLTFEFRRDSLLAGGLFDVAIKPDATGLRVAIKGTLSLALRPGVKSVLTRETVYRIQGVSHLGGSLRGFMSPLKGQHRDDHTRWLTVTRHNIQ